MCGKSIHNRACEDLQCFPTKSILLPVFLTTLRWDPASFTAKCPLQFNVCFRQSENI